MPLTARQKLLYSLYRYRLLERGGVIYIDHSALPSPKQKVKESVEKSSVAEKAKSVYEEALMKRYAALEKKLQKDTWKYNPPSTEEKTKSSMEKRIPEQFKRRVQPTPTPGVREEPKPWEIKLPEIKLPEIKLPEFKLPEIKLPIPEPKPKKPAPKKEDIEAKKRIEESESLKKERDRVIREFYHKIRPKVKAPSDYGLHCLTASEWHREYISGRLTLDTPDFDSWCLKHGFPMTYTFCQKLAPKLDPLFNRLEAAERRFEAAKDNFWKTWVSFRGVRPPTPWDLSDLRKWLGEMKHWADEYERIADEINAIWAKRKIHSSQAGRRTPTNLVEEAKQHQPKPPYMKTPEATKPKPQPIKDTELVQLKHKKDELIAKIKEVTGEGNRVQAELSRLLTRVNNLKAERARLENLRNRLSQEIANLQSRLAGTFTATKEMLQAQIRNLESYVNSLRNQKAGLEAQIRQLEDRIRDLRRRLSELGISAQYFYRLWTGGSGYLSPGGSRAGQEYHLPTEFRDVSELNRWKSRLRSDISREEGELSNLKNWLSGLKSRLSSLRGEESSLSAIVSRLRGEVDQLKSRVEELRKRITGMAPGDLKSLQARLNSLEEERARLESEISGLMTRLSELRSEEGYLRNLLASAGVTIPTPPVTISPTIPSLPEVPSTPPITLPTAPSPDVSGLLTQMQNLQQQLMNLQYRMMELQSQPPDPTILAELQSLRQERAALSQQLQSLQLEVWVLLLPVFSYTEA